MSIDKKIKERIMEDMFLIQYDKKWYRASDKLDMAGLVMANFSMIIKVAGTEFPVLKDRYSGFTGHTTNGDLVIMKLFAEGKSLMDLPKFIACKQQHVNTDFVFKENGDLCEEPIDYYSDRSS